MLGAELPYYLIKDLNDESLVIEYIEIQYELINAILEKGIDPNNEEIVTAELDAIHRKRGISVSVSEELSRS